MAALYVLHYAVCNVDEYWKKFTLPRTGRHDDYWWVSPAVPAQMWAGVSRAVLAQMWAGVSPVCPGAEEERSGTI